MLLAVFLRPIRCVVQLDHHVLTRRWFEFRLQQTLCRWPVLISGLCCSPRRQSRAVQMRVIRLAVFASACAFTYTLFATASQSPSIGLRFRLGRYRLLNTNNKGRSNRPCHAPCRYRLHSPGGSSWRGPVRAHSRCLCCWCCSRFTVVLRFGSSLGEASCASCLTRCPCGFCCVAAMNEV